MFKGKYGKKEEKYTPEYPCLAQWDDGKIVFIMSDKCHGVRIISEYPSTITGKVEETNDNWELCNSPVTLENL